MGMALTESPNQQAWREFGEEVCVVCNLPKEKNHSFCWRCYYKLPPDMRKALYRRFGSGYEEAYDDAKDYLVQERKASKK